MSRATPHGTGATAVFIPSPVFTIRAFHDARPLAWIALGLACLLLGGFLELPEAIQAPGSDTGMFATQGAMLLHGARPYVDFWDLHPPLVFGYWASVQAITGSDWLRTCVSIDPLAPQSCTGLAAHVLDLLLSVAAALVVAAIARQCGGSRATAALAALLVVGFAYQAMLSQEGSNPSKLTLLPSSVAVWAYLRSLADGRVGRSAVLAGVAAAIAGLAKQPALLTLVALAGHAAWHAFTRPSEIDFRNRIQGSPLIGLLVGFGATLAVACAALAAAGALDGFVTQAWVYNVERVLLGYFVHPPKPPVIGLDRVLTESAGALAAFGVIGACSIARTTLHATQRAVLWWALVNLIAITALREFVYVVPSTAVVAALGLGRLWRWPGLDRALGRGLLLAACLACIVLTTGFQRGQLARARFERLGSALAQTEQLGWIFRRDLPPGPLFVYGNGAELYPLANRTPATRYLNAEALRSTAPGVDKTRAELVTALRSNPPPVIVLAPHSDEAELDLAQYPAMRAFLQDCYAQKPIRPDIDAHWAVLLRTAACAPDASPAEGVPAPG